MSVKINNKFSLRSQLILMSSVFWDISPCSPLEVSRRFGRICRLHLEIRRISQARNRREATRKQVTYSSKTYGDFQRTAWVIYLYNHRCENLRSNGINFPHAALECLISFLQDEKPDVRPVTVHRSLPSRYLLRNTSVLRI
jgi:hypothetical protein